MASLRHLVKRRIVVHFLEIFMGHRDDKVDVLAFLRRNSGRHHKTDTIADGIGRSPSATARALYQLELAGLIKKTIRTARDYCYEANMEPDLLESYPGMKAAVLAHATSETALRGGVESREVAESLGLNSKLVAYLLDELSRDGDVVFTGRFFCTPDRYVDDNRTEKCGEKEDTKKRGRRAIRRAQVSNASATEAKLPSWMVLPSVVNQNARQVSFDS
jgi:predicted transcriptional regulator